MKYSILTILIAGTLGGTAVMAQTDGPPPGDPQMPTGPMTGAMGQHRGPAMMFERMDRNGDGIITRKEIRKQRGEMFDRMDRNKDGYLEADEARLVQKKHRYMRKMHRAERRADRHMAMDTDKDGKISLSEFTNAPSPLFTRLDSNGDGVISTEEQAAARSRAFARMDVNGDGYLSADDKKMRRAQFMTKRQAEKAHMDTDKDGRISRSEFIASVGPVFEHFDINGDGKVTREEMQNAPHKGMMKGHEDMMKGMKQ